MCKLTFSKCWTSFMHKRNHKQRHNLLPPTVDSTEAQTTGQTELIIEISTENGIDNFSAEAIEKAICKLMRDNEETIKQSLIAGKKQLLCSMCQSTVSKSTVMMVNYLCPHVFCTSCMEKKIQKTNKCPICVDCVERKEFMENQGSENHVGYVLEKHQQKISRVLLRFTGEWRRQHVKLFNTLNDWDRNWDMKPC